jgi:hypothetical protein
LNPAADTYVTREARGKSFGKSDSLLVSRRPEAVSYVRFELRDLDREEIEKAVLRLYATTSSNTGISIFAAGGAKWDENRLTYDRGLRFGGRSVQSGAIRGESWVEIDVTSLVRRDGSLTLALATSGQPVSFASRETGDHAPQLVVTIDDQDGDDRDGGDEDDDHDDDDDDHDDEDARGSDD